MFATSKDLQRVEQSVANNTAAVKELSSSMGMHLETVIEQVNRNSRLVGAFLTCNQSILRVLQDLTETVQNNENLASAWEHQRAALEEMIATTMTHVTQLHGSQEDLSERMTVLASRTNREIESLKNPVAGTVTTTTLPPKDLPNWISVHQIRDAHRKDTGSTATNRQLGGYVGAIARQQNLKTVETYRETPAIVHSQNGEKHEGIAQYYSLDAAEILLRELRKKDQYIPQAEPEEGPVQEKLPIETLSERMVNFTPVQQEAVEQVVQQEFNGYQPMKNNPVLDYIYTEYDARVANGEPKTLTVAGAKGLLEKLNMTNGQGNRFIQDAEKRGAVRFIKHKRGYWGIEVLNR